MKRTLGYSNIMEPMGYDLNNPYIAPDFYIEYLECGYHEMLSFSKRFLEASLSTYGLQDSPVSSWNIQLEMDGGAFTIDFMAAMNRPAILIYGYNVDFHNRSSIKINIRGEIVENFVEHVSRLKSIQVPEVVVEPHRVDCKKELRSIIAKIYKALAGQLINGRCDSDSLLQIIGLAVEQQYGDDPQKIIEADSKPISDSLYQLVFTEFRNFMMSETNEPNDSSD